MSWLALVTIQHNNMKDTTRKLFSGMICLTCIFILFGGIAYRMGVPHMLNSIMNTAHDLLLNTVFYLMGICVLTGAIGKLFVEFGVVDILEKLLKPFMRPLFHLPGMASLGAVMTFLSDNPAIISLSKDEKFARHFKRYQYISLTNFGTTFGMGLIVIIFMVGQGFYLEPLIGFFGAFCGSIVSTRFMQYFILRKYPQYKELNAIDEPAGVTAAEKISQEEKSAFLRTLDALLDGGKSGVEVGIAIIPGVLIISTLVMILTFGPGDDGIYTGAAYEGVEFLPYVANQLDGVFQLLFGFTDPHQIAFPITALGAVGAALSLVPNFIAQGWVDGNAIAVFTAIGMCWSGYLSTHTAMLDSLGYRQLTSKAIISHTIGGLVAALAAHLIYLCC